MLTLTFLGTSAGVPTKQRNVTGLGITFNNPHSRQKHTPWLLVDCGEGTQHQILHTPLSLQQLRAICITHVHGDHCYGLPGLLASMAMNGRTIPLTLIAPMAIGKLLDALTITTELYFSFEIEFIALETLKIESLRKESLTIQNAEVQFEPIILDIGDGEQITIEPIALSHRVPSHAFIISQQLSYTALDKEKLLAMDLPPSKIWGSLQHGYDVTLDDGRVLKSTDFAYQQIDTTRIIVAGDNDRPELLKEKLADVGVLVHEATYTQAIADKVSQREDGFNPMHSSALQVASVAESVKLPNLILTHFSGRFQAFDKPASSTPNMGHIRVEVEQAYSGNCWLANDFDRFEVEGMTVTPLEALTKL